MLKHTMAKLAKKAQLTVAYFGGSITQGAGSSDYKYCWRSLTTAWLKENYPESAITEVDASIGGTGSELGTFREYDDVLRYSPDLVFVEFAVNDSGSSGQLIYEETLLRKLMANDPDTDIVLVLTITENIYRNIKSGKTPESFENYKKLSEYYKLLKK